MRRRRPNESPENTSVMLGRTTVVQVHGLSGVQEATPARAGSAVPLCGHAGCEV